MTILTLMVAQNCGCGDGVVEKALDEVIEHDIGDTIESLVRKTVEETLQNYGVLPQSEESENEKESETAPEERDRLDNILEIVDEVVKENLHCASPSFKGIRKQAMDLFWLIANRLEKEGIPVTPEDQRIILKRIWDHLKKTKVCPLK